MTDQGIRIRHLRRRWERALGAMFRKDLGREVLVFVYRRAAARRFHTFFCPPLRVIALADDGAALADLQPEKNRLFTLPASRLVVECAPAVEIEAGDLRMIADFVDFMDREG